jgi:anti-sigma regulatory factor (Ser/Thr protein kinase)
LLNSGVGTHEHGPPEGRDVGDGPKRWEGAFQPEEDVAAPARDAVEDVLTREGVGANAVADALLVLNELVANAIRHARTEFTVTAVIDGGTIRLEVFDRDTRPPMLVGLDAESTSGRGLHIVAGIARDWGWQTAEGENGVSGKVVWAELAEERADARAAGGED